MATNAAEFLEYSANLPTQEVDESCDKPEGEVQPSNNLKDSQQSSSPAETSEAGLKIEEYQPPPMPRNNSCDFYHLFSCGIYSLLHEIQL